MYRIRGFLLLAVFAVVFILPSCDSLFDDSSDPEDNEYLVSNKQLFIISELEIDYIYAYFATLYPEAAAIQEKANAGVKVYKITYKTHFRGDEKIASGLVCIPIGKGPFPVLSYQNGTNTLHSNAPSANPNYDLYKFLETVASTGFVLAIPDYLGFGESSDMFHPYLDKEATVNAVSDMLLAVKELTSENNLNVKLTDDLYIAGYSMGGWATLQVQKEIEDGNILKGQYNLKASACGAGPYNLFFINSYIMNLGTYPMPYFLGFMVDSYIRTDDITNTYAEIFNEPYASRMPELFDGTKDGTQINSQLTTSVSELFTDAYKTGYLASQNYSTVRTTLMSNSIEAWAITTPLLLLHGESDVFVPAQVSENLYNDMINLGVSDSKVKLITFPAIGHQDGIIPAGVASIKWFLEMQE